MYNTLAYNLADMREIQPDRVKLLMDAARINQSKLAELVGVKQPSIGRILSGETKTSRHIHRIAEVLGTTPYYLFGETEDSGRIEFVGSMEDLRQFVADIDAAGANPAQAAGHSSISRTPNSDLVEIDYVEIGFGMGGGFIEESGEIEKRSFSRAWLREFTDAPPELLAWAKGDGDSMEPTIRDGEVVLIDRRFTQPGPNDQIWAITVGDFGMIKRLRARPDGAVEIHSDNPLVQMQTAVDGELHVIGRVRAVIRRV
ncbi:XRE family transcriptional regulator [Alteraurantiacibacter buctensis]|uniref:Helix-turn-helix domain-containing protein n=1 Tax=Alteraurantiacibacter buctensis TaxID=1503981 RepID=A0A844Z2I3_9SPHN|nr:LexA family transcriptional regulator [Alteraurantiacibacter buctensis]MXO73558.1 helix-turn-helix domain-containing protein [Alteraurantiacibacter buctensis]